MKRKSSKRRCTRPNHTTNNDINASNTEIQANVPQNEPAIVRNESYEQAENSTQTSAINIAFSNTTSSTQTPTNTNESNQTLQTYQNAMLININEINTDLNFIWKIHATVTSVYPKRNYTNSHSVGEISCWDLKDNSGSITLAAFNLNSHIMSDLLQMNQTYEFSNLSVRLASDSFKTLAHSYQLVCTNTTVATQITSTPYDETPTFNFVHLIQIADLPLNSIIDVQANVVRDFGISTGVRNASVWTRRYLHITQDGIQTGLTLWNDQARLIDHNMTGLQIKLKNVKISSFDG
ncbi:unnamed protein product [Rotaria socialis]